MSRKLVFAMILTIIFAGTFAAAFDVQRVKAGRNIYIRADGTVDPTTAPISNVDNVTYTFTNNIYDSIIVERDGIVVDGAGYTIQGPGSGTGIDLSNRNSVKIKNMKIKAFDYGVYFYYSSNNSIIENNMINNNIAMYLYLSTNNTLHGNNMINNGDGVWLRHSSNNVITENNIANNNGGILLFESSKNALFGNNIANNRYGIIRDGSSGNSVYHNNFFNNIDQVAASNLTNVWDSGYPSGGNYWSDYTGVDLYSGPYQNVTGSDGIGDRPYVIDQKNVDNYPLTGMFSDFNATSEHHVQTISNSTISNFQFNGTAIIFNVSDKNGTVGFCRICIPTALMNVTYKVFVNGTEVSHTVLPFSNSTHSYLYFTYNHPTQEVLIVSELPSFLLLPLSIIATMFAKVVNRRKHSTKQQQQAHAISLSVGKLIWLHMFSPQ